jgi:hypothetical protein
MNTKGIQNLESIILNLPLNEKQFDSLEYYLGCKGETSIVISTEEVLEEFGFCLSEEDRERIITVLPKLINFIKV